MESARVLYGVSPIKSSTASNEGSTCRQVLPALRAPPTNILWWVWRSWLARQIVALEAEGSSPSTHPYPVLGIIILVLYVIRLHSNHMMQPEPARSAWNRRGFCMMGYRQAVRHSTLTAALAGSNPASPVKVA